jgi:hypothetical protein
MSAVFFALENSKKLFKKVVQNTILGHYTEFHRKIQIMIFLNVSVFLLLQYQLCFNSATNDFCSIKNNKY